jgi:hypothetical protein
MVSLGLEEVRWTEDSSPNPTLVSAHGTDAGPEVFEDLLDPAVFDVEAPTSQSTSSGSFQDTDRHSRDSEDEDDLPSLDSLLYRNPPYVILESSNAAERLRNHFYIR